MAEYDPRVIQQFADSLYAKANALVANHVLMGLVLGGGIGYGAGYGLHEARVGPASFATIFAIVLAVIGGAMGYSMGMAKSFVLRLQAQTALCQIRIEEHLRSLATKQ